MAHDLDANDIQVNKDHRHFGIFIQLHGYICFLLLKPTNKVLGGIGDTGGTGYGIGKELNDTSSESSAVYFRLRLSCSVIGLSVILLVSGARGWGCTKRQNTEIAHPLA